METYPNGAGHDIRGTGQPRFGQPRSGPSPSGSTRAAPVFRKQRTCAWIRAQPASPWPASPGQRQRKRTRAAPSDRSPSRWQRAWSPLSTGCPGPFQAQPPVQPDERRSPLRCHAEPRGRLDASALHHDVTPNLTSLPVRLASPGAGLSSNLPLIPAMSTVNRAATLPAEIIRLHFVTARGKFCSGGGAP
jgi:hypothetical protein